MANANSHTVIWLWASAIVFVSIVLSSIKIEAQAESHVKVHFFDDPTLNTIAKKFFATVQTVEPHKKVDKASIKVLRSLSFETPEEVLKAIESYPDNGTFVEEIYKVMQEIESKLNISCKKKCDPCAEADESCDILCGTAGLPCIQADCPPCPIPIWCPLIPEGESCPPKPICPEDLCPKIRNNTPGFIPPTSTIKPMLIQTTKPASTTSTIKPDASNKQTTKKSTTIPTTTEMPIKQTSSEEPRSTSTTPMYPKNQKPSSAQANNVKEKTTTATPKGVTSIKVSASSSTSSKPTSNQAHATSSKTPQTTTKKPDSTQKPAQCDPNNIERGHSPILQVAKSRSAKKVDSAELGSSRAGDLTNLDMGDEIKDVAVAIKRSGLYISEMGQMLSSVMSSIDDFVEIHQRLTNIIQSVSSPENPLGRLFTMFRGRSAEDKRSEIQLRSFKGPSLRDFSYDTNLRYAQRIIVEILHDLFRRKCNCPSCPSKLKRCNCSETKICKPLAKGQKCPACPAANECPVPVSCKKWAPCQDCNDLDLNKYYPDTNLNRRLSEDEANGLLSSNAITRPYVHPQCPTNKPDCEDMKKCGIWPKNRFSKKKKASGYMRGGEKSEKGEWASYVRIDTFREAGTLLCGGVVISRNKVLTAAHCISDNNLVLKPGDVQATAGAHDAKNLEPTDQYRNVTNICRASKFHDAGSAGSRYDYAVLTVDKPFQFNDDIQPACLAYNPKKLDTQRCWVVGMGITDIVDGGRELYADRLLMMKVKRVSCNRWQLSDSDPARWCFTKALGPGDTCGGDSGGPVLCLDQDNRWTVLGLVSYGSMECDGTDTSVAWVGVYTRIPALLDDLQKDCKLFTP